VPGSLNIKGDRGFYLLFIQKDGVFFQLFLYEGLLIYIEITNISREIIVFNSRHPWHGAFWSDSSATTYNINTRVESRVVAK
jgi:hypothetical protein